MSSSWQQRYDELLEYQQEHGNGLFPNSSPSQSWLVVQQSLYKKNRLSQDKVHKLEALGVTWDGSSSTVNSSSASSSGVATSSSSSTNSSHKDKKRGPGRPAKRQRSQSPQTVPVTATSRTTNSRGNHKGRRNNNSSNNVKDQDDTTFSPFRQKQEVAWDAKFEMLLEYKAKNGHCCVAQSDKPLGTWVNWQRMQHKYKKLRKDRMERLQKVGFVWKQGHGSTIGGAPNDDDLSVSSKNHKPSRPEPVASAKLPKKRKRGRPKKSDNSALQAKSASTSESIYLPGSRVAVYWSDDETFHSGIVKRTREDHRQLWVAFDAANATAAWVDVEVDKVKPLPRSSSEFQVGQAIDVYWSDDDTYYRGRIADSTSKRNKLHVEYNDGDEEWVDLTKIKVRPVESVPIGSHVEVYWSDDEEYYLGQVTNARRNGEKVHVTYEDGDREWVDLSKVQRRRARERSVEKAREEKDVTKTAAKENGTSEIKKEDSTVPPPAPRSGPGRPRKQTPKAQEYKAEEKGRQNSLGKAAASKKLSNGSSTYSPRTTNSKVVEERDEGRSVIAPGLRVKVFWPAEQQFFAAKVEIVKDGGHINKPHFLRYEDGETEWTNLGFRQWREESYML